MAPHSFRSGSMHLFHPARIVQAVYLGGVLNTHCIAKPEITRRLGEARGVFQSLHKCWSHANNSRLRKVTLYRAVVVSKLLYNLESVWTLQADRNRLNSFHAQCLRKICRIPCAYVSRVSNHSILERTGEHLLSEDLFTRQKKLYKTIAALSEEDPLRKLTCEPNSNAPRIWDESRSRGRPRQQWASCARTLCADAP